MTPTRSTEGCEGEGGDDESLCVGGQGVQERANRAEKAGVQVKARLRTTVRWLARCEHVVVGVDVGWNGCTGERDDTSDLVVAR